MSFEKWVLVVLVCVCRFTAVNSQSKLVFHVRYKKYYLFLVHLSPSEGVTTDAGGRAKFVCQTDTDATSIRWIINSSLVVTDTDVCLLYGVGTNICIHSVIRLESLELINVTENITIQCVADLTSGDPVFSSTVSLHVQG